MGTLLSGVAGVCMFAGVLFSAPSLQKVVSDRATLRATANPSYSIAFQEPGIQEADIELRVIETRILENDKGVVVFDRSGARDSVIVDASVLSKIAVGDLLSDYEGTIER
jgi:hypothetical protein